MRKGQKLIKTVFHNFYSGRGEDASQLFNPFNLKIVDDEIIRLVIGHIHDMPDEEFDRITTTWNIPNNFILFYLLYYTRIHYIWK